MSRDPVGYGGGDANLYRYVENEPTGTTDPSGLREPQDELRLRSPSELYLDLLREIRNPLADLDPGRIRQLEVYSIGLYPHLQHAYWGSGESLTPEEVEEVLFPIWIAGAGSTFVYMAPGWLGVVGSEFVDTGFEEGLFWATGRPIIVPVSPIDAVQDIGKLGLRRACRLAKNWLGKDYRVITNKAGDRIFMSKRGTRKIRFDINNPRGDKPHIHLEVFKNGRWWDAIPGTHRIYPK